MTWGSFKLGCRRAFPAGVASLILSAAAAAQPLTLSTTGGEPRGKIVIGDVYHESSGERSYSPTVQGPCQSVADCWFLFSRVRAGMQLIVSHVSCVVSHGSQLSSYAALLTGDRPNGNRLPRGHNLTPVKTGSGVTIINTPTLMPFGPRDRPLVLVQADGATSFGGECSIAGRIVATQ